MSDPSPPTHSVVEYFYPPESKGHRCGYCKSSDTNFSHGMWAHTLSPENYEHLINIGWRRSGCYVYKPMNEKVCCPMYTIRNLSTSVEVSRSQRKVLKRFRRYLSDGIKGKSEVGKHKMEIPDEDISDNIMEHIPEHHNPTTKTVDTKQESRASPKKSVRKKSPKRQEQHDPQVQSTPKPHPLKKKRLRRERKRQKLIAKGLDPDEFFKRNERNRVAELEKFFQNEESDKLRFTTKLVKVKSKEFEKHFVAEHKLYQKYQMHTHGDVEHECRANQFSRFLCDNPFGDDEDEDDEDTESDTESPLGTYHQHYYVNSILIAVGVIDILPHCVSSVYFFYDPDYSFLSPGTLGALQEMSFVNQLNKTNSAMKYYYLGFYIHSCVKMRYKRKFRPCELVCPVTYEWVSFDERVAGLLDAHGYALLKEGEAGDQTGDHDVEQVLLLYNRRVYAYSMYPRKAQESEELQSYVNLVGGQVASNVLLYRSSSRDS